MQKTEIFIPLLLIASLSGCSIMAIRKHEPNFKSTRELKQIKMDFYVLEVTAKQPELIKKLEGDSLTCRLAPFNMPANTSVGKFIRDALTDELDAAGKLSNNGSSIKITVNRIETDTGSINNGHWYLDFNYETEHETYNVQTDTLFESAYMGDTACRNAANAFTDALTDNFDHLYQKYKNEK